MPHRRFAEGFLLRRIEPFEPKQGHIRLAHQRRFAPETHQFRRTPADDVSHHHSIDAAGRSTRGRVKVGVAIEPEKINVLVVAPRTGKQADDFSAIAPQHQYYRTTFHPHFFSPLEIVHPTYD